MGLPISSSAVVTWVTKLRSILPTTSYMSDVTFDMRFNQMHVHCGYAEPWRVTLIDTGEKVMTGAAKAGKGVYW